MDESKLKLHALNEPCEICDGRGYDYLGRPCRLYLGNKENDARPTR